MPASRWTFLAGSVAMYAASMVLPVGQDEGPPRLGFGYLVLGGYFLAGALMSPANLLYAAGCFGQATRRRTLAVVCAWGALALGVVGVVPLALTCDVLRFPAYWLWLASFVILLAGEYRLPRAAAGIPGAGPQDQAPGAMI